MDAPKKIHVRWGKSGDTRVTYMEERFWPPDNEAEYILAAEHDRLMAEKTAEIERLRESEGKRHQIAREMIRCLRGVTAEYLEGCAVGLDPTTITPCEYDVCDVDLRAIDDAQCAFGATDDHCTTDGKFLDRCITEWRRRAAIGGDNG